LPGSRFTDRQCSVFEHTRLEPFLDQANDAFVADTVLKETDQPLLADRIEKAPYTASRLPFGSGLSATFSLLRSNES
jgi:hypothetical protein